MIEHHAIAQDIARELGRTRLRMSTEAALQIDVQGVLDRIGYDYAREKPLGPKDRPDFLAGDVAIEVKARYSKRAIYRQLERYAGHDAVRAIVLVTGTALGMPAEIKGKPIYVVNVGMAFL